MAAGQVSSTNFAVVVAVKGVVGTGRGSVGVAASQVLGADLAVVVAVKRVVGASGSGVVGKTTLPQTSIAVVVGGSIVVAMAGVLVAVGANSLVGETCGSSDTTSTADVLGNTLELVVALLTASKSTAFSLELLHGHSGESGGLMVSSLVMVNLMDGDSGVDDVGLNSLLLDNGLDSLVDVLDDVSVWWGVVVLFSNLRGGRALRLQWEQHSGCGWCPQCGARQQSELGRQPEPS